MFVLPFVIMQHLLVHDDLLGESGLDAVAFLLRLVQADLENTDGGLRLAYLAGLLLDLLESRGFLVEDIVDEFAGGEGERGKGSLPVLQGRKVLKSGRRLIPAHPAV